MLKALDYLCQRHVSVVHRDIKPENFIFRDRRPEAELCLIDFGLSQTIEFEDEWLTTCCGTVQ